LWFDAVAGSLNSERKITALAVPIPMRGLPLKTPRFGICPSTCHPGVLCRRAGLGRRVYAAERSAGRPVPGATRNRRDGHQSRAPERRMGSPTDIHDHYYFEIALGHNNNPLARNHRWQWLGVISAGGAFTLDADDGAREHHVDRGQHFADGSRRETPGGALTALCIKIQEEGTASGST